MGTSVGSSVGGGGGVTVGASVGGGSGVSVGGTGVLALIHISEPTRPD